MSFIRTADEPRIPFRGVFWILMCLLAGGLGVRYCAPFPPQLRPHSERVVPACSYCAVALEDSPATFVRSCSGGCDERV